MVAGRTSIILQVVFLEVVLEHGIVTITQDTNRRTGRPIVLVAVPKQWHGDNSQSFVYRHTKLKLCTVNATNN
jgi:hypothetical protein